MNPRKYLYQIITGTSELMGKLGNGVESVFSGGELTEAPSFRPFIVIRMLPTTAGPFPGTAFHAFQIWFHGDPERNSYVDLDEMVDISRSALRSAAANDNLLQVHWESDSEDRIDDQMRTIVRATTCRIAATLRYNGN